MPTNCAKSLRWIIVLTAITMTVAPNPLTAQDFDGNGSVGFEDFLLFATAFGSTDPAFDLDGDGQVAFGDFLVFADAFGSAGGTIPSTWNQISSSGVTPLGRLDHTMILDSSRSQLMTFGGRRNVDLDDTWIYDLANDSWREVTSSPKPDARRGHVAVYDASRDRVVIFGGEDLSGRFFNDTWVFSLATETWSEMNVGGSFPSPRYGLSAILDAQRDRMIISHGFTNSGRFDDTWALDLATLQWSRLSTQGSTPQARCLHDAAFDEAGDGMYLFGGCSSGVGPCPRNDLWRLDLATTAWQEVTPTESPDARSNLRLACRDDEFYLFGGVGNFGTNDVWRYAFGTEAWRLIDTEGELPPGRWSTAIVWDAVEKRMIAFGGTNGAVWYDDLWELRE